MPHKVNTYQIAITIIEGRHYIWENVNSAVIVRVANKKKSTAVQKCTDNPFYNEYFVFELECAYEKLLEMPIVITVIQPRTFCRKRKILGSVKLDIATVVNQKNSQFYHRWAVLASPKTDVARGPTGYLKVDITFLSRGQTPKFPLHIANDEIEGNLLTPMAFVGERQRAKFIFDIYRCEHLHPKTVQFTNTVTQVDVKPSSQVVISFAGAIVSTTMRKTTQDPVFNERLTITDLFPPLCQRVKIEVCLDGFRKSILAVHFLNLKHISNDAVEGFLPTFGPTYLYLYSKQHLEDYVGTILMAMRTEFLEDTMTNNIGQKVNIQHGISALQEESLFSFEETYLFATIFEANCLLRKYQEKHIAFRVTFGNVTYYFSKENGDNLPANASPGEKLVRSGEKFYFLNYADEKPCLTIKTQFPDFRKRMFHSNMLEKISNTLKSNLKDIELLFSKHTLLAGQLIEERLKDTSDNLFTTVKKYLELVSATYHFTYGSDLDRERIKICFKTMNGILDKLHTLEKNKSKKFVFRHLDDIQKKIESLIEDAQPCWPDVFVWMTCSNKKIANVKIPAREIVFSPIQEEKGVYCGKIRPLLFSFQEKNAVIGKIEILMWLGLEKQKEQCINNLPNGFLHEGRFLKAREKYLFEGKAYIFEGEIQPGFDESGLVDPYVQVALGNQMKETEVKKNVLVPLWDQTLIFPNMFYYGSKQHIKENPPWILVQMFDQDPLFPELIGRAIVQPLVYVLDDRPEDRNTKLKFHLLLRDGEILCEVLAAFELNEISTLNKIAYEHQITVIPRHLKPQIESYRVEVVFWGVRNLKKVNFIRINRPKVTFYCGNKQIESRVIENARKFSNFLNDIGVMDVHMPSQTEYPEAFQFKLFDSRKFGVYVFGGISISDTTPFLFTPLTVQERLELLSGMHYKSSSIIMHSVTSSEVFMDNYERAVIKRHDEDKGKIPTEKKCWQLVVEYFKKLFGKVQHQKSFKKSYTDYSILSGDDQDEDFNDFDWWTKFYASFTVYTSELEHQPEFKGFSDTLTTFEIFKGKRTGDEILDEQLTTAIFKGSVKIYQWPPDDEEVEKYVTPNGRLVKDGVFSDYPSNSPLNYILRVYCVRALNLRPKDINGKSDPYLQIQFGQKIVSDRENYVPRDVNPIFGRCFEFHSTFPDVTSLVVRVMDYDVALTDDLIGETKIDIENRFYTKHRAKCGIPENYFTSGYCKWRDQSSPSEILKKMCLSNGLSAPEFNKNSVLVGPREFSCDSIKNNADSSTIFENLSLEALKRWQEVPVVGYKLVPEHVETRSLFTPDKPGIEQGKIQLWIDIFSRQDYVVPEQVNITPRKPKAYELRVIIWNTEDILLAEDDIFTGEKKSDIYIKGWLDLPQNTQYTDVHYRSLTGEGNFNWRFIFKFEYLITENKLVIKKKESTFLKEETVLKVPCILHLSVWDNDSFSSDDFLGSLNLDLSRMPRPARASNNCNLSIFEPNAKKINLFKLRRTRGWWPFQAKQSDKQQRTVLGGKLEAELEILTKEEADLNPVGIGRQGPEPLPPPKYGDRSQRRHLIDEESSTFCYKLRHPFKQNPFRYSKCIHCKKQQSKDCKIFLLTVIFIAILLSVVIFLYLNGYMMMPQIKCMKNKREAISEKFDSDFT
ncbi:hypothetical protein ABEB36_001586 [Hypothenemus hampei]|uniref:C2 domain-containing protein n=1 Tax=Hypothenemus hampei TaxID=57062 RepID=A0ABD1FG18_HYPHA